MQNESVTFQFPLRTILIVTAICAIFLGGYVLWRRAMDRMFHGLLVGKTGSIDLRDQWPEPLKKLVDDSPQDIVIDNIKVYCLCQGFDPEYVWRMDATTEFRDDVISKWRLTQVPSPTLKYVFQGRSHNSGVPTPDWWKPTSIPDIQYFACPGTIAGEKSARFQVAYSETTKVMYVHYWFNF